MLLTRLRKLIQIDIKRVRLAINLIDKGIFVLPNTGNVIELYHNVVLISDSTGKGLSVPVIIYNRKGVIRV